MDPSEIEDQDTLEAWLETQSREVAVTIAHRAAMRVAPVSWRITISKSQPIAVREIRVARQLLISGLAGIRPTPDVRLAAATASVVDAGAVPTTAAAANYASSVAYADLYVSGVVETATINSYCDDHAWRAIRREAVALDGETTGQSALLMPLWPSSINTVEDDWPHVRSAWVADTGVNWQFWIDWYDAALEGRPLLGDWDRHWALLTEVALIESTDWDAGTERVNPLVADIYEKHRLRQIADNLLKEKAELRDRLYATAQPPRDHNNPPELLDNAAYDAVAQAGETAHEAVREISEELASPEPDSKRLENSANRLADALSTFNKWVRDKGDLFINAFIEELGRASGRYTVRVIVGSFLLLNYPGEVSALVDGVLNLVRSSPS